MSGPTPGSPQLKLAEIQTVLIKASQDPVFAAQLKADPSAAVQSLGFPPLHADEIEFFSKIGASELAGKAAEMGTKDPGGTLSEL